ncbi:ExeM/NucH family extracellular endonuclease [Vibrio intestinalis]|uniref:ExeM/NucH family extracellular endonuclease n=1 Tax=Vibrio intestinalis TaxID=2933291 RepID=UPI0021A3EC04|nr:ExeM/NucH family extracellular endonuclease [Vibrio intestinalis]
MAASTINDIVITEYLESSVNKYARNSSIEITNNGDSDFTFTAHALYYGSGGNKNKVMKPDGTTPVLQGVVIPSGESIVVVSDDATNDVTDAVANNSSRIIYSGSYNHYDGGTPIGYAALNFDGNDAVWIAEDSDPDAIHDIIGDKNSEWGKEKTFRRVDTAKTPDATYNSSHWVSVGTDEYSDLGKPTYETAPSLPKPCDAASEASAEIYEIQGSGKVSPLYNNGITYEVTGTVSAVSPSFAKGFYLVNLTGDNDSMTSDGIFVDASDSNLTVDASLIGKEVCVVSKALESEGADGGMTYLKSEDGNWQIMNDTPVTVNPVDLVRLSSDANFEATLERYEGMFVKTVEDMDASVTGKQDMRVSRTISYDYDAGRNNIVMAYERPNPQPNQDNIAGSQASHDQMAENNDRRLYLESDQAPANGKINYYPDFSYDNYVRINDSVIGVEGAIHYSDGQFRMVVQDGTAYTASDEIFVHNTPRNSGPSLERDYDKGFTITVATQNVLNFFNSPYGGSDNQFGDNRGAETELDYERQKTKIVEAIYDLDADIIGLMEIENNGFGDFSAINDLLAAINAKYSNDKYSEKHYKNSISNRYIFVGFDSNGDMILDENDAVGSDAITTGLIYRPSTVSVKSGKVIAMPMQDAPTIVYPDGGAIIDDKGEVRESGQNYQRNSIAATFQVLHTGKKLTVAVNHLKSKGSTCYEDWQGWETWEGFDPVKDDVQNLDYQGNCENFRVAAVSELGERLAVIGGDQVVLGDFNAYAHEDPMLVMTAIPAGKEIKAAGYTYIDGKPQYGPEGSVITKSYGYVNAVDLLAEPGETSWSYSYNDEVGSLDHLLITKTLKGRLVDATDWHINAPESPLMDYSSKYKTSYGASEPNPFYDESPYRSSDHDSALVSLGYKYAEAGENPIQIAIKSGRTDIAFPVNSNALDGDVAEIAISPRPDGVALPKVTLNKDGAQTVMFDVTGLEKGEYTFTMTLRGQRTATASTVSAAAMQEIDSMTFSAELTSQDSSNVEPILEEYDGSGAGGSLGFGALLSLFGFGFLRRRFNA